MGKIVRRRCMRCGGVMKVEAGSRRRYCPDCVVILEETAIQSMKDRHGVVFERWYEGITNYIKRRKKHDK